MITLRHYYCALFFLGINSLTTPLHAVQNQAAQPNISAQRAYTHGNLTFILHEKENVNLAELRQGLIDLSQKIKAKEERKVYFFLGVTPAGKSLSILALQGNKISKRVSKTLGTLDDHLFTPLDHRPIALQKAPFQVTYVVSKDATPLVTNGAQGSTKSTAIYYPDPNKPQAQTIAFADTPRFFQKSEATSAAKCLTAASLFYALKVNNIGGLVFVLSATSLDRTSGLRELILIAHILQAYFAKGVEHQSIQPSFLLMITNVHGNSCKTATVSKLRQCIQAFYQTYYAAIDSEHTIEPLAKEDKKLKATTEQLYTKYKALAKRGQTLANNINLYHTTRAILAEKSQSIKEAIEKLKQPNNNISPKLQSLKDLHAQSQVLKVASEHLYAQSVYIAKESKNLEEEERNLKQEDQKLSEKRKKLQQKKQHLLDESRRLKLFFEMLLVQDVPRGKIDDIRNFTLDANRFCFILPWEEKSVQYVLNKRLKSLTPLPSHYLSTFDNPVTQYLATSMGYFSDQLNEAIQPLLAVKRKIEAIEKHIAERKDKQEATKNEHTWTNEHNRLVKAFQVQRKIVGNSWKATAQMLLFFAHHLLEEGSRSGLIKAHIANFQEATQLNISLSMPTPNSNMRSHLPQSRSDEVLDID